jgi:hypothetical protein
LSQLSFMPVRLVDEQPKLVAPGVDGDQLQWIGLDEQDRRYALKTIEDHRHLPITEWLCYNLCALAGIITPQFSVVIRLDGSEAFGSLWEQNAKQYSPGVVSHAELATWLARTQSDMAGMFALDAFLPNEDRHMRNVLFVDTGARLRALAFDWSKARLLEPWPWPADSKSSSTWGWMLDHVDRKTTLEATKARMDRICAITGAQVGQILNRAPMTWRQGLNVDALASDWDDLVQERSKAAIKLLEP